MFLTPKSSAESLPSYLYDKFGRIISDGALARLLMLPEQPYTNPNFGALKLSQFNAACDANFALNIRGEQRAAARTKASFF